MEGGRRISGSPLPLNLVSKGKRLEEARVFAGAVLAGAGVGAGTGAEACGKGGGRETGAAGRGMADGVAGAFCLVLPEGVATSG